MTAEQVVQQQLEYYNAHDLEGFLSTYHQDAVIYRLTDHTILMQGIDEIRERYAKRFMEAKPHAVINNRIVVGNQVIDEEHVTLINEPGIKRVVAIYEVVSGSIRRVWFLYD